MDKVIPVVVIKELGDTIPMLKALQDGGVNCAEITFRTACAEEAIKIATKAFPDMNIGAGTVINVDQCDRALKAGARFIVSPGLSDSVFEFCKSKGVEYFPGCVTPTEIMHALDLGINIVKFFPANVYGGLKALKALAAPFTQIKFIPTGGVDLTNIREFLEYDRIYAIGGSFMMKGDIKQNCEELQKILKEYEA